MHSQLFMDKHFIAPATSQRSTKQQYHHQNNKLLLNESRHIYSIVLFHQIFVNVCNTTNIDIIIVSRKVLDVSIEPILFQRFKQNLFGCSLKVTSCLTSTVNVISLNPSVRPLPKINISFFLLSAYRGELPTTT